MAENKASTSMMWQRDTRDVLNLLKNDPDVSLLCFGEPERQAAVPGGLLIKTSDGSIIGAVGSSRRDLAGDEEAALIGVKSLKE